MLLHPKCAHLAGFENIEAATEMQRTKIRLTPQTPVTISYNLPMSPSMAFLTLDQTQAWTLRWVLNTGCLIRADWIQLWDLNMAFLTLASILETRMTLGTQATLEKAMTPVTRETRTQVVLQIRQSVQCMGFRIKWAFG